MDLDVDMDIPNRESLIDRIRQLSQPMSPIPSHHATRLEPLSGIRCVAFDFYGTMFMSGVGDIGIDEEQKKESESLFVESLKSTGFEIESESAGSSGLQILRQMLDRHISQGKKKGIPYPEPEIREVWKDTLLELSNRSLIQGSVTDTSVHRFAIEFEFRINTIWPVPNLKEILRHLLKMDLKLGIISNSQFYTPLAFEALIGRSPETLGFEPDLLVWSFATGRKKPDTEFYRVFVDKLEGNNLDPEQVLYVGNDIRKDIEPAKSLGMRTALFVGDKRSIRHEEAELENAAFKPDLVADDLFQISDSLNLKP